MEYTKFFYKKVAQTQPKKFWYICDFYQWHKLSDDIITKVLKTISANHIQTFSQLLKAHVVFDEWVFWHKISPKTCQLCLPTIYAILRPMMYDDLIGEIFGVDLNDLFQAAFCPISWPLQASTATPSDCFKPRLTNPGTRGSRSPWARRTSLQWPCSTIVVTRTWSGTTLEERAFWWQAETSWKIRR